MLALLLGLSLSTLVNPPVVGEKAPDFEVTALDGQKVRLNKARRGGPVVLVVLRGWPGYQCPFCTAQVGEYMANAEGFAKAKATVVMVYPGPAEGLKGHAQEFVGAKDVPKNFRFTLDPDYKFTNSYGLRWEGRGETAYPSTFVIGKDGKVAWAKVSRGHGDRAKAADVLAALG